jgi:flagellar secretion chaperone FliS
MSSSAAVDSYRRTQVQGSTPLERIVMLYDGALRFTAQAREAMDRSDIPTRRDALSKAIAIVGELQATLDMERGAEISASLDRLYDYVQMRLLDATIRKDPRAIDDARRVLETLREAWQTIAAANATAGPAA